MKYNGFNVPDKEIDILMEKMDISLADACELWLSDHDMVENETVEELSKKATKNRITSTIHQAKGTNTKKDIKNRKHKENPLKKEIISDIFEFLQNKLIKKENFSCINVTNDEKFIDFTIDNRNFTINLIEHRSKK